MGKMIRCDVCHKLVDEIDIFRISRTPLLSWTESSDAFPRTIYKICRPCLPVLMELMNEAYQGVWLIMYSRPHAYTGGL